MTTQDIHPIAGLTDEALQALLKRAIRDTLLLGLVASLIVWAGGGWRNAGLMAVGGVISAASILEWQRLIRLFNAKLDQKKTSKGAATVVGFFLLRLTIFAGAIYVSLKCFRGSAIALLAGLGLAIVALAYEALRLLKD